MQAKDVLLKRKVSGFSLINSMIGHKDGREYRAMIHVLRHDLGINQNGAYKLHNDKALIGVEDLSKPNAQIMQYYLPEEYMIDLTLVDLKYFTGRNYSPRFLAILHEAGVEGINDLQTKEVKEETPPPNWVPIEEYIRLHDITFKKGHKLCRSGKIESGLYLCGKPLRRRRMINPASAPPEASKRSRAQSNRNTTSVEMVPVPSVEVKEYEGIMVADNALARFLKRIGWL